MQDQYVSALQQVILLLQQQVNLLLQQLNALQIAPPSAPVPVTVITPTELPPAPVFGNTPTPQPSPAPTIVKDLTLTTDTATYPLTGWGNTVNIKASYTESGIRIPATITFTAPNKTGTFVESGNLNCTPSVSISCGPQQMSGFNFVPTVLGTNTITATANGITKTIDINVIPYTKIDPQVTDIVNKNGVTSKGYMGYNIGTFTISQADEPIIIDWVYGTTTLPVDPEHGTSLSFWAGSNRINTDYIKNNPLTPITVKIDVPFDAKAGQYTVTIEKIRLDGQTSGLYRNIDLSNSPITFTFEVK